MIRARGLASPTRHAAGRFGYVLRGMSFKDRAQLRLDPVDPDPVSGDTKIWSEDFTALEVMTGSNIDRFYSVGRWWLQMVGRGFTPTAT